MTVSFNNILCSYNFFLLSATWNMLSFQAPLYTVHIFLRSMAFMLETKCADNRLEIFWAWIWSVTCCMDLLQNYKKYICKIKRKNISNRNKCTSWEQEEKEHFTNVLNSTEVWFEKATKLTHITLLIAVAQYDYDVAL